MRVLFAFDPGRTAILLIGGDKRDRWQEFYERMIPLADELFDEHLEELESGSTLNGHQDPKLQRAARASAPARPRRDANVAERRQAMQDALALAELRKSRHITQVELAATLGISQGNVSRLEARSDMYLSTLRSYDRGARRPPRWRRQRHTDERVRGRSGALARQSAS